MTEREADVDFAALIALLDRIDAASESHVSGRWFIELDNGERVLVVPLLSGAVRRALTLVETAARNRPAVVADAFAMTDRNAREYALGVADGIDEAMKHLVAALTGDGQ